MNAKEFLDKGDEVRISEIIFQPELRPELKVLVDLHWIDLERYQKCILFQGKIPMDIIGR